MANSSYSTTESLITESKIDHHEKKDLMAPDAKMMLLTWIAFFILLAILSKYAWKPILSALDKREEYLRKSIDDADKIQQEMEALSATTQQKLTEADQKTKEIIIDARKAAIQAAKAIESKAKEEAQILIENAQREIKNQTDKAQADLKIQSARIAVDLAEKLIEENLSDKRNREFVDKLLKDM